ncbi:MAG: 4Fe-4S dicluster domain-containing protein [Nitrospirota bacterium]
MKRKLITIDEALCDGCGNCVTACAEGALQIVNGKAKLVKEDFCDGFGDCIGECPTGALKIEERDAKPFNLEATKEYLLRVRGKEAVWRMEEAQKKHVSKEDYRMPCGCPGSMVQTLKKEKTASFEKSSNLLSGLRNWPVQIALLPINSPYYEGVDLLVAADCCAYAYGNFHKDFIQGRSLAIGCPKFDNTDLYREKLTAVLGENNITSITVAYMEVPCCLGLVRLVGEAVQQSGKDIPLKTIKISVNGQII